MKVFLPPNVISYPEFNRFHPNYKNIQTKNEDNKSNFLQLKGK
jgi:hypothetical protein